MANGDCCDAPGLFPACGGDGTGVLAGPIAQHFHGHPDAVCGYAHSIWPLADTFVNGFPWGPELVASGFTRDARCIDPSQRLAVPNLQRYLVDQDRTFRAFFPLLGAVDAVLGEVAFIETIALGPHFPLTFQPPANWHGLSYRLTSLGLRIAFAAGSDQDCAFIPQDELPRTYVWLNEPFGYDAWTRGLAAGQTSVGVRGLRLDLHVGAVRAGESLYVATPAELDVAVEVLSEGTLDDAVELLVGGEVVAVQPIVLVNARTELVFGGVDVPESTWLAARLVSQRAHTGPLHVYADGQPISDCAAAEYWMLWCDIVAKTALQVPQLDLFGCQRTEALARLLRARRAFKSYRDIEGFDPSFGAERYGLSTPGPRGPISIATTGPARSEQALLLTCVNAPPLAQGTLYLSRVRDEPGTCAGDVRFLVGTEVDQRLGSFPAQSTRSGYAEVLVPEVPAGIDRIHAQFVWTNPHGQRGRACGEAPPLRSASDALTLEVEQPVLLSIELAPVAPTLAKGTSLMLTATGLFSDGRKRDLTGALEWSSSDEGVVRVESSPGEAGRVTGIGEGQAEIAATDVSTGIRGSTPVVVTPAVLTALEVAPVQASLALGFTQPFTATGVFSDATTQDLSTAVAWSSSDPAVATVDPTGLAATHATGVVTIVATEPASSLQASAQLTVTPAVLVALEVAPLNPAIPLGTSQAFTATGVFSDGGTLDLTADVAWSSSEPIVATVASAPAQAGLAVSHSVGTTQIRATEPESGVTGASLLEVTPAVLVTLEVAPAAASVPQGLAQAFHATGIYTDASTQDLTAQVLWSSSDPGVAVVSNTPGNEGLATGLSLGTVAIMATDPATLRTADAQLTVTPAVLTTLRVLPAQAALALGFALPFAAEGDFSDGSIRALTTDVTWSSSDPTVAAVSNAPGSEGLATSLSVGRTTVTATDPESQVSAHAELTVTPAILTALEVLPSDPSVALGLALAFRAHGAYSDGTTQELTESVTWSSSDPAVAAVSNAPGTQGHATTLAVGTTDVQATAPKAGVSGTSRLTVTPAVLVALAVAPADAVIGLGTSTSFTATGTYSDGTTQDLTTAVTWSSSDLAVASIANAPGSQGLAQALGVGTTTITAHSPKTGLVASTMLSVRPVLQTITVQPAGTTLVVGATRAFVAIGAYNDGSTADVTDSVLWSSSNPAVASIRNDPGFAGVALALAPGLTTIHAADPTKGVVGSTTLRVIERR